MFNKIKSVGSTVGSAVWKAAPAIGSVAAVVVVGFVGAKLVGDVDWSDFECCCCGDQAILCDC